MAVQPSHPFAARDEVYPADLTGQDFIGFDEDLRIRRELDRFLLRVHGVEVNLAMHFDNIQTIKEAVALGSGMSILPARTVKLNAPDFVRPVGIVHRKRKKFNSATRALLEMLTASQA